MIKPITYAKEAKLEWFGPGPWVDEPDHLTFEYRGYTCAVLRTVLRELCEEEHYSGGSLCGYVRIPPHSKWYRSEELDFLDCHGGITLNHAKGEHWIGFDCAHSNDIVPSIEKNKLLHPKTALEEYFKDFPIFQRTYKDLEFVIDQCRLIVDQLLDD